MDTARNIRRVVCIAVGRWGERVGVIELACGSFALTVNGEDVMSLLWRPDQLQHCIDAAYAIADVPRPRHLPIAVDRLTALLRIGNG